MLRWSSDFCSGATTMLEDQRLERPRVFHWSGSAHFAPSATQLHSNTSLRRRLLACYWPCPLGAGSLRPASSCDEAELTVRCLILPDLAWSGRLSESHSEAQLSWGKLQQASHKPLLSTRLVDSRLCLLCLLCPLTRLRWHYRSASPRNRISRCARSERFPSAS